VTWIILALIAAVPGVTAAAARTPADLTVAMRGAAINAVAWIILAASPRVACSQLTVASVPGTSRNAGSVAAIGLTITASRVVAAAARKARTTLAVADYCPHVIFAATSMSAVAVFRAYGISNANLQRGKQQHHGNDAHPRHPTSPDLRHYAAARAGL
jgi:hypothetical protein